MIAAGVVRELMMIGTAFFIGCLVLGALVVAVAVLGRIWGWWPPLEAPEPLLPPDPILLLEPDSAPLTILAKRMSGTDPTFSWTHDELYPRTWPPPHRPYDWAHREAALAPDHYITHRGLLLGRTEWPPR